MTVSEQPDHADTEPTKVRRPIGLRHLVGVALATALLASSMTAYANHTFSDVPDSNPFHSEISWMAETGISTGFDDGTYRPSTAVSRQAMSAFMQRLYNLQAGGFDAATYGNVEASSNLGWVNAGSAVNVTIPPGTNGRIHAMYTNSGSCESGTGTLAIVLFVAPTCQARILIDGDVTPPGAQSLMYGDYQSGQAASDPDLYIQPQTSTLQAVSAPLEAGTYAVTAQIRGVSSNDTGSNRTFHYQTAAVLSAQVMLEEAGA